MQSLRVPSIPNLIGYPIAPRSSCMDGHTVDRRSFALGRRQSVGVTPPHRRAGDSLAITPVGITLRHVHHLLEQASLEARGLQPELDQALRLHDQVVLGRLVTWIWQIFDPRPGQSGNQFGKLADTVDLRHLIEDLYPVPLRRRMKQ